MKVRIIEPTQNLSPKRRRVCAYARVSSTSEAQGDSLENQTTYCQSLIESNPDYSVVFPDLNHLATCGETLDKAFAMGVDCLAGYPYTADQDGEKVPHPSAIVRLIPIPNMTTTKKFLLTS